MNNIQDLFKAHSNNAIIMKIIIVIFLLSQHEVGLTQYDNTWAGNYAGHNNTGSYNTFFGAYIAHNNGFGSSGESNSAFGAYAGYLLTSGKKKIPSSELELVIVLPLAAKILSLVLVVVALTQLEWI